MKVRLFCMIALVLSAAACSPVPEDDVIGFQNPPMMHGAAAMADKA
jgi:hypothetical protein